MQVNNTTTFSQIYQQRQAGGEFDGKDAGKNLRLSDKSGLHIHREDKDSGVRFLRRAEKHEAAATALKQSIDNELGPGKDALVFKNLGISSKLVSLGQLDQIHHEVENLKETMPRGMNLARVDGQRQLLEGTVNHTMNNNETAAVRANFDHKIANLAQDQFDRDFFRANIHFKAGNETRTLPITPGQAQLTSAKQDLAWIAGGDATVARNLGKLVTQSAANAMQQEFGPLIRNAGNHGVNFTIPHPGDNVKQQTITVTQAGNDYLVDVKFKGSTDKMTAGGSWIRFDPNHENSVEMTMQMKISRNDLAAGQLTNYVITQPPAMNIRAVFDPINGHNA